MSIYQFFRITILLGAITLPLTGCAGSSSIKGSSIKGSAAYRERIALPPNAVFEAVLEDVSKQDVMAERLGRVTIEKIDSVPVDFKIPYKEAQIKDGHSYSVRARIMVDEKLYFITDTHYPVITRGHGNEVELLLKRVGSSNP